MDGLWRRVTAGRNTRGLLAGLPLLLAAGCMTASHPPGGTVPAEGYVVPPRIVTPAPGRRTLLKIDPGALPEGARAHFPAFDGDPIIVTLPAKLQSDVTRDQVLKDVVGPVLKALGFSGGLAALAMPPGSGVKQPKADFKRLAAIVADKYARNPELQREKAPRMLGAFLGIRPAYPEIDRALLTAEGMAFTQFVAGIERLEIQYPFQQVHQGVPIERGMLVASRLEGQTVTSVFGSLFGSYAVENKPALTPAASVTAARRALLKLQGIEAVPPRDPVDGPTLMLLPYGTDSNGVARLRYAYRILLEAVFTGQKAQFLVWIDADNALILKVEPFASQVMASGVTYNRDPGVGTIVSSFEVDASLIGSYTLRRALPPSPVSTRLDYKGDGFNGADLSIPDSTNGSSASFANFDQPSINDPTKAMCAEGPKGSNKVFQQVSFFATLMRQRDTIVGQGIFEPFPQAPWSPMVENTGGTAWFNMNFGAGDGYKDPACPDFSDGTTGQKNFMNFAQDNTMIGHEIGHNATWRLTTLRPPDWCGQANCSLPVGWAVLHDLADFWGAQLEATNCIGGWVAKNMGGTNASLNCLKSSKTNWLPRKLEVQTPMVPGDSDDHFPEHKGLPGDEYANGQVGGAALWHVLEGMRSKCGLCGPLQFGGRFQRALKQTGFFGFEPSFTDTGIYQLLYDLEAKMADQWATSGSPVGPPPFDLSGPHTTNKVTAGFARAGIFLIPYQCLGAAIEPGDAATSCPAGGNGGDAVIDIDDNDTSDDPVVNGVTHPQVDFLKLGGVAPKFHVWTGPRYRLNGTDGAATFTNPAPCNGRFRVEVSSDPAFPAGSTISSAWKTVSRNPSSAAAQCYGTWTPTAPEWTKLQEGGAGTLLYYRGRTQRRTGGNERLSTLPGNGLWSVPPPYAVITATGQPDY